MSKPGWKTLSDDEKEVRAQENRRKRMAKVDEFDPEMRALIHEYGLYIVQSYHETGITKPNQIKHLVEMVLDEFSPSRGSFSQQGARVRPIDGGSK